MRGVKKLFFIDLFIDINRLRRYRALEFRQPVTQGKHSVLAWCSVGENLPAQLVTDLF